MAEEERLVEAVARIARPLRDDGDLDPLLERIGDARVVLLGEASHGTHEFYAWRDRITRRLVREKGFHFIAVEGDWPDCYLVNRWVKGVSRDPSARAMLHAFERWPTWMWANEEATHLAEWLREHNDTRSAGERVGFYGLDVYSLWDSMDVVTHYLEKVDPQAAARARRAYGCFDPYEEDVLGVRDGHRAGPHQLRGGGRPHAGGPADPGTGLHGGRTRGLLQRRAERPRGAQR